MGQPIKLDLLHHRPRLLLVRLEGLEHNPVPFPLLGPQLLAPALGVMLDNGVGRVQDDIGRTVVLLQLDHLDLVVMLLQIEQIGNLGPAPAVDALVVVPHHAEIAVFLGEQVDQVELRRVRVLILIHHDIPILGAAGFQHFRMLFEQFKRQQQQVIEVHRVAGPQG